MKHLRKYNESKIENDIEYCFCNVFDIAKYKIDNDSSVEVDDDYIDCIDIIIDHDFYGWVMKEEDFIKYSDIITVETTGLIETDNEIMQDIQYSIEKVRVKYPDAKIETVADFEEIDVYVKLHEPVNT